MQETTGDWWDIGSFWVALIALIVSVAAGAAAVWVTYRVSLPRRRLVVRHSRPTSMAGHGWLKQPFLMVGLRRVRQPHLVEVAVGNDGNRSISGALFDQGRPIVVDFGKPVVSVRHSSTRARGRSRLKDTVPAVSPGVQFDGSEVRIGPGMLAPLQIINIVVLVDGEPSIEFRNSLVDVPWAEADAVRRVHGRFKLVWRSATLAVAAVATVVPLALDVRVALAATSVAIGITLMIASTLSSPAARRLVGPYLHVG